MTILLFPGQGSQHKGMGADLFDAYPALTAEADAVLGYSIRTLCLEDPQRQLTDTRYTQPAIYVVSALALQRHRDRGGTTPQGCAGHSLGEYSALYAAGVFDFATGLTLVKRRGELMARIVGGAMAAVIGLEREELLGILTAAGVDIDIANHNSHTQLVLSGPVEAVGQAEGALRPHAGRCRFVRLRVSGAFHSRMMQPAADAFAEELRAHPYAEPRVPVIANCSAEPYRQGEVAGNLGRQLCAPVRWLETMQRFLDQGARDFLELGPGEVLTRLAADIRGRHAPRPVEPAPAAGPPPARRETAVPEASRAFMERWGCGNLCVAGSLGARRTTPELLASLADAGVLCFAASEGLSLPEIAERLEAARAATRTGAGRLIGLNVHAGESGWHAALLDLAADRGVMAVELAGLSAPDEAVVLYRARGIAPGHTVSKHRILVKLRDTASAAAFLEPAPGSIVEALAARGALSAAQAEALRNQPLADAVCLDRSSWREPAGGAVPASLDGLLGGLLDQHREIEARDGRPLAVSLGVAGALGAPADVAAALRAGAHFVVIGSALQIADEAELPSALRGRLGDLQPEDYRKVLDGHLIQYGVQSCIAADDADTASSLLTLQRGLRQLACREQGAAELLAELAGRDWPVAPPVGGDAPALRDWMIGCAARLGSVSDDRVPCSPAAGAALRWWQREHGGPLKAASLMNRLQQEGLSALMRP